VIIRAILSTEIVRRESRLCAELGEEASVHLSYEMVALHRACGELASNSLNEDRKRPHIEMSGRKGLGVQADSLISRLKQTPRGS